MGIEALLQQTLDRLLEYCKRNRWSGFDPFDGLSSRVFAALPFAQNRIGRLVFIQAMKRSPVNLRPLLLVPKSQNPKGLAVFASSLLILSRLGPDHDEAALHLLRRLIDLRSPNSPYHCWGYNFDWQSRAFFLPKFVPNIICTTFAGNALLDAHDRFADAGYLDMALSAGDFILNGLNVTETGDGICFSYTPLDHGQVHNANFLGAAYLARLYSLTGEGRFLEPALKAVRHSLRAQDREGAWPYGEDKTQRWVDNFHTGYNLVALKRFSQYTGNNDVLENIRRGFQFYIRHFFTKDGIPKYFHDQFYPIDIHAVAYSIITLVEFQALDSGNLDLARRIFSWAAKNMLSDDGYFFYQSNRFYMNRIPYMRWSQAWMLLALSTLLVHGEKNDDGRASTDAG